jgi:hypothetical protein
VRVFKRFAWLEVGSGKAASPCPTHQRVTPTVRQPRAKTKSSLNRKFGFVVEFRKVNLLPYKCLCEGVSLKQFPVL